MLDSTCFSLFEPIQASFILFIYFILTPIIITITINNSNRQKVMGIKYTQHKDISWSKRYRGKVALIHTKKIIWNRSFIEKEIDDRNPKILKGPPKK